MYNRNILEEELKNKIGQNYFCDFDDTKIIGKIDFCITLKNNEHLEETISLFWAEAKKGKSDIYKSIIQLILTIGKARTFDKELPPPFIGAFDAEKIAFIPYNEIQEIFYQNDFNWKVAPSNHKTKEFEFLFKKIRTILEKNSLIFYFHKDEKDLQNFIKLNFIEGKTKFSKIQIDKNNFLTVYLKWLENVKNTIVINWKVAQQTGIIDADFFLADLLSVENQTLKEKLYVILKKNYYELDRIFDGMGMFQSKKAFFKDNQKTHLEFWKKYQRPPKKEYWDYIIKRRDLLVPQDVRERKGSFFTPKIWVEMSQKYISDVFGEDWQDEYFIWDCAAGTGNLLNGLTNKYNIWASTIDQQDVDIMKDRIKNGTNLLESHVFKFDFLNDDLSKLPKSLSDIINNPEKREKLIIYINPPYAEGDARIGRGRKNIQKSKVHDRYKNYLGKASGELFAQFFIRIYKEMQGCLIAQFSTLKHLQAPNFSNFRNNFEAKLEKMFIVPAKTFDNVKGNFPIGFMIWNTSKEKKFKSFNTDIYDDKSNFIGIKKIYSYDNKKLISVLIEKKKNKLTNGISIGHMSSSGNDFQNQNALFIENLEKRKKAGGRNTIISSSNFINISIYFAVRKCIKSTWLNDREQFLYPKAKWKKDKEFQNDCLAFTLFNNNIDIKYGTNHWIPFTENEVNAKDKFESNFMTNYISGKINKNKNIKLEFSEEAKKLFESGKELWIYYHLQENCNVNASFYNIKEHFQGRSKSGRMKNKSDDENYTKLIKHLKNNLNIIAKKIEIKVYEYEFLKK